MRTLFFLFFCSIALHVSAATDRAAVALGRFIFFDTSLSADGKTSCSSCHIPEHAFAGSSAVGIGVSGRAGTRNAPSLIGIGTQTFFFWDGRRKNLTDAVLDPFTNPIELGLPSQDALLVKVRQASYAKGEVRDLNQLGLKDISNGLVAFIKSIDRAARERALNKQEELGLRLFSGPAGCSECHRLAKHIAGSDGAFHHSGVTVGPRGESLAVLAQRIAHDERPGSEMGAAILSDANLAATGRFAISKNPSDLGAFRTPSLRNVALTAPYMHDGSVATLEEAVAQEIYYRGFSKGRPINLSKSERDALLAYLSSLSDK